MNRLRIVLVSIIGLCAMTYASASGPIGIYGVVEKVVFEPDEQQPQRMQLWGAFAFVNGTPGLGTQISAVQRGYLYFQMPSGLSTQAADTVKNEWRDFKAVAGTGQAVGFGYWGFVGPFEAPNPDGNNRAYILQGGVGGPFLQIRVRAAAEPPAGPATYTSNVGVVKLSETGSHAEIVKQLKAALKR
jgi:hypothetical protein